MGSPVSYTQLDIVGFLENLILRPWGAKPQDASGHQ